MMHTQISLAQIINALVLVCFLAIYALALSAVYPTIAYQQEEIMHTQKLVGLQAKRIAANISDYILPFQPASDTSSRIKLARLVAEGVLKKLPFQYAAPIAHMLSKTRPNDTRQQADEVEAAAKLFLLNVQPYLGYKPPEMLQLHIEMETSLDIDPRPSSEQMGVCPQCGGSTERIDDPHAQSIYETCPRGHFTADTPYEWQPKHVY